MCRAQLPQSARFCPDCGRPSLAHKQKVAGEFARARQTSRRAGAAVGMAVVVCFVGLLASSDGSGWRSLAEQVAMLGVAIAATRWVAGPAVPRAAPPRQAGLAHAVAVPTAAVSVLLAVAYLHLLQSWFAADAVAAEAEEPAANALVEWLSAGLVAPIGEELLCRGVVFAALLRLGGLRSAWLASSVLFAFLHGLGPGYLFELPHRFVGGLLFGALRAWSGRLTPAMLAHALHNAVCLLLPDIDV